MWISLHTRKLFSKLILFYVIYDTQEPDEFSNAKQERRKKWRRILREDEFALFLYIAWLPL